MEVREIATDANSESSSEEAEVLLTEVLAQSNDWGHMNGWSGGWMWLWGVAMMAGFVALVVWLARSASANSVPSIPQRNPTDRAKEILAERYAKGDLSPDEYQERISQLQ